MELSSIPLPVLIVVVALAAAVFLRAWIPLMDTREQKVKIGVAAALGLVAMTVAGVGKFGWPLKTALAYYTVLIISFAIGTLGHGKQIRAVASREAEEGPSKENQMPGLMMLQLFGVMVLLFFVCGKLITDF
ncbi:hypothetical protein [Streptomyces paludis]|uniref:Uncharacterized protein n=1 Tax=Streptomyces paludis TaxID=2282738 RepID=A0A345HTT0_9ACTN|nr:hypothetical protein [Streptomyces paludis]AXG80104.1 hypothetical protein DVK44_23315 [Streptomyces paludis]